MEVTLGLRERAQLEQLHEQQQDPNSPLYHHWLTPAQFTASFGPTQHDAAAVVQWLGSAGFQVTGVSLDARYVRFTGEVSRAEMTFGTPVMDFGHGFYSNTEEPKIPAHLSGVVAAIAGLDNFTRTVPVLLTHRNEIAGRIGAGAMTARAVSGPEVTINGATSFGPADLRTFYDETPLINAGTTGAGDCIAIVGTSDFLGTAVTTFDSQFGLPASSISKIIVDTSNPGFNAAESEALLDLEYSHAIAPAAAQHFYLGNDATSSANGSVVDAIQQAVTDNVCSIISVSFSNCATSGTYFTDTVDPILNQAVTQGQTVFFSSGDQGAAGLIFQAGTGCVVATTAHVNELASPHSVSVGGTGFTPNFDASGNDVGFVPESVWDDEAVGGGATGGGISAFFAKPTYQSVGTPADGKRDQPDISLIASANFPGVFVANDSTCDSTGCSGAGPVVFDQFGGTSLSAPLFAGLAKIIVQKKGGRLGLMNTRLYQMALAGLSTNGFRDVTSGNNNFNGVTGFTAVAGYDRSTGWGTVDMAKFANAFVGAAIPTPTHTPIRTPSHTPTRTPGEQRRFQPERQRELPSARRFALLRRKDLRQSQLPRLRALRLC
jgi:kumamolisin